MKSKKPQNVLLIQILDIIKYVGDNLTCFSLLRVSKTIFRNIDVNTWKNNSTRRQQQLQSYEAARSCTRCLTFFKGSEKTQLPV